MLSSNFHDGNITSISTKDGTLVLCVAVPEETKTIVITELERLRVSDFKEGNIVNTAQVFSGDKEWCDEGLYMSLIKYVYGLSDEALTNSEKLSLFLKNKVSQVKDGSLLILEIQPSYGGYIVAIGKSISEGCQ